MILVAEVGGDAQTLTTVVNTQGKQTQLIGLAIDGGIAVTAGKVEPHTDPVIGQASGKVAGHIGLAARADPRGELIEWRVGRPLGHDVDRAAEAAAAGGGAVQEGVGAAQHFHTLDQFRI